MSFGYTLVKVALKLKGEKRSWSVDPINYSKKREQDIHHPTKMLLSGSNFQTQKINKTTVTRIVPKSKRTKGLLFYCPGGGFVYGPTKENWKAITRIAQRTGTVAWMVDYPKAPEHKIKEITENIFEVYQKAAQECMSSRIVLLGDSAGGNLILSLTQQILKKGLKVPNGIIAITPVIDASLTNPKIKEIDTMDPILSIKGVRSAKKMVIGDQSLKSPLISPIYGSFSNFPPVHIFSAEHDILTPDQELLIQKIKEEGVPLEVIIGKNMPHVWPILPIMSEAKMALSKIISIIDNTMINE